MPKYVVSRLLEDNKLVFSRPSALTIHRGDLVIINRENKEYVGKVINTGFIIPEAKEISLASINRIVNDADKEKMSKNEDTRVEATNIFLELLKNHHLPIVHVKTVPSFNENKIIFYFFSEVRIDFRDLVKDLAKRLKKRVELWQINQRERVKLLGGLGPCGQETCCSRFIAEFSSIGVNMAKLQGLLVSPEKISGLCGRLMCCLKYELLFYEEMEKKLPKVGDKVSTNAGDGVITGKNLIKSTLSLKTNDNSEKDIPLDVFLKNDEK